MGLALEYDISPQVTAHVTLTNIVDICGQRGYAWDNPNVCVYGSLPSGIMAPKGNFYPNSQRRRAAAAAVPVLVLAQQQQHGLRRGDDPDASNLRGAV